MSISWRVVRNRNRQALTLSLFTAPDRINQFGNQPLMLLRQGSEFVHRLDQDAPIARVQSNILGREKTGLA